MSIDSFFAPLIIRFLFILSVSFRVIYSFRDIFKNSFRFTLFCSFISKLLGSQFRNFKIARNSIIKSAMGTFKNPRNAFKIITTIITRIIRTTSSYQSIFYNWRDKRRSYITLCHPLNETKLRVNRRRKVPLCRAVCEGRRFRTLCEEIVSEENLEKKLRRHVGQIKRNFRGPLSPLRGVWLPNDVPRFFRKQ